MTINPVDRFAKAIGKKNVAPFREFLDTEEGKKMFSTVFENNVHTRMSSILNGARTKAKDAFKDLYHLWFDEKKGYLKKLKEAGVDLARVSGILHAAGAKAPKAFEDLCDLWFDEKKEYLKKLKKAGVDLARVSSILSGSGANAPKAFKDLCDLWFDEKKEYIKKLKEAGVDLARVSGILHAAGAKAPKAFKDLYDLLLDEKGEKKEYLKKLKEAGVDLARVSSILSGAGANAPKAFEDLCDLWFDEKKEYLKKLKEAGVDLARVSGILHGAGAKAPKAFEDLCDLWFDEKKGYLKKLKEAGVDLARVSGILHGAGAKAPKAFKDLYDLLLDEKGEKKEYLKKLKEAGVDLARVSSILSGAGANAPKAFKDLCDLWFDEKKEYIKKLKEAGVDLASVSSILSGAGANAPKAFKDLYYLWFDEKKEYIKKLKKAGIDLVTVSSILSGAGAKAKDAFKDLYYLWFDDEGGETKYLRVLEEQRIDLVTVSNILTRAAAKAKDAFKDLYHLWFDEEEEKTKYLRVLEEQGIDLASVSSILHGAGAKAKDAFKDLYHLWFDEEEEKTKYLTVLEKQGIDLVTVSSILSGAGAKAPKAFEDLYNLLLNKEGERKEDPKHLEKGGRSFASVISNLGKAKDKGLSYREGRENSEEYNSQAEEQLLLPEKNDFTITESNPLIDKDSLKKYTLEEFKKELEKEGKIEYRPGVEAESRRGIYKNNVEKGEPKILIAQVAALKGEKNWGVFAKDEIKAGTFLGTFAGERMSQDENLESLYVFNVGKKTIIDGEKKRNWASYLNHGSINNVNLQHFIEKFQNKGQVTFYAKVDISPNSQLLFDYGEGYFSKLGNYNPIYLHPTDNDLTPSQRYNSVKDVYYDHVIELDEKIAQGLGYSREKYFVVPKLFQKIYNNEDISDDKTLSKGLNTPIYAVKLNGDKKWEFYSYDKQQQATSLMLACYSGREGSVKSLLRENSIDITRSTLHGGRNALFFTILSDTDDKGTKESILGFLVNKIKDLYKSNKVNEYVSELLYAPDGSGKNLFDHMMDKGEYSLYKAYYEKSSKPWQKKVAEEYIADQGILSIVLSLGTQEHVEVIDALLKRLSASFTRTCLKNDVKDKENVDYRKEQLSKLKQLTNLSEAMKKEMIEILEEKYGSSTDEKELETSDQHSQIEKRRKVFGHNLAATDEKELETSDQHSQIEKGGKFSAAI
ncbi:SET domain-containing protein-lysine N-methyltransferase [Wolbachia endosymbiont of Frankliniella intonsa]|uniref:SET domain-containing protein-lysine N-methyltransferase n=1 Tax=Wolbachia endosymbiont of Frankliniella intonsa TaxID=2902422 RepID=UPI00244EB6ED|nr:SET domain-containing protein-lysine N-methyltransferase [Wolbachia endosymbiont of Frankliniella intonsa]WGJ62669.1 SET domain-containing protein-lysine N-methyltransferase [Wolbachia endosymbiont of Frankliniella intonsa]